MPMNLYEYLAKQREWSERTFGHSTRTNGITRHIEKELAEIRAAPHDLSEWIDVVILALDGAWRAGYLPEEIIAELERKQAVNFARKWPPAKDVDPEQPSEHVRTATPPAAAVNPCPPATCKPSHDELYNACLSYRHDYGLLSYDEQTRVRDEALYWFQAWSRMFPQTKADSAAEGKQYPEGSPCPICGEPVQAVHNSWFGRHYALECATHGFVGMLRNPLYPEPQLSRSLFGRLCDWLRGTFNKEA